MLCWFLLVFGNNELYLILKGSVMPLGEKYLASNNPGREQNFPAEKRNETETEITKPKVHFQSIFLGVKNRISI